MLEGLIDYADRKNLRLVTRPARVGELLPSQEVLVTGMEDGVIYAIERVQVKTGRLRSTSRLYTPMYTAGL